MLSIDSSVIAIFIIIWILVLVLSKKFFKPVQRIMAEREAKIQKNRESSEKSLADYEKSMSEIEKKLREAKAISDAKKEELEKEALREKKRFLEEINAECRTQIEKARTRLIQQTNELKKELESEVEVLSERIEKKLVH